jgi:ketosteroid isomerase-like protein
VPAAGIAMNDILRAQLIRLYDAFYAGRIDDALACYSDAVEYVCYAPVSLFPDLGFRHGKAQLAQTMQALHRQFHQMRYTVVRLVAGENEAAAILDVRMEFRKTGRLIQLYVANFIRFKEGAIVDHRTFMDSFDALEQLAGEELDFGKLCPDVIAH